MRLGNEYAESARRACSRIKGMIESLTNTRLKAKTHSKSVIALPGMRNAIDQFRAAIQSAGLIPPDMIEPDGKLHRFASNGTRGDDAGWYTLHADGIPAGSFGDWRSGQSQTWRADIGRTPTPAEEAAHRAKVEAMRREREAEKARFDATLPARQRQCGMPRSRPRTIILTLSERVSSPAEHGCIMMR